MRGDRSRNGPEMDHRVVTHVDDLGHRHCRSPTGDDKAPGVILDGSRASSTKDHAIPVSSWVFQSTSMSIPGVMAGVLRLEVDVDSAFILAPQQPLHVLVEDRQHHREVRASKRRGLRAKHAKVAKNPATNED